VALIAVVCIAAVTLLGKNASTKFSSVGGSIK
jgi:Flp pilus assembly pilin Flp